MSRNIEELTGAVDTAADYCGDKDEQRRLWDAARVLRLFFKQNEDLQGWWSTLPRDGKLDGHDTILDVVRQGRIADRVIEEAP